MKCCTENIQNCCGNRTVILTYPYTPRNNTKITKIKKQQNKTHKKIGSSPSPSSSGSCEPRCAVGAGLRCADWKRPLRLGPVAHPASPPLLAYSRHSVSRCDTCDTSSSPAGAEQPENYIARNARAQTPSTFNINVYHAFIFFFLSFLINFLIRT